MLIKNCVPPGFSAILGISDLLLGEHSNGPVRILHSPLESCVCVHCTPLTRWVIVHFPLLFYSHSDNPANSCLQKLDKLFTQTPCISFYRRFRREVKCTIHRGEYKYREAFFGIASFVLGIIVLRNQWRQVIVQIICHFTVCSMLCSVVLMEILSLIFKIV